MNRNTPTVSNACLLAIVFEGSLGLLAVGIGWLIDDPPAERLEWSIEGTAWGIAATLPLIAAVWTALRLNWRPIRDLLQVLQEHVIPMFRGCRVWEFAIISAFSGIAEELLFRGLLQNWVTGQFSAEIGPYVGLAVASLVFGLLHWLSATYAALAAVVGLYLGGLWIVTENLLVPALTHAFYNFWALVYLTKHDDHEGKSSR